MHKREAETSSKSFYIKVLRNRTVVIDSGLILPASKRALHFKLLYINLYFKEYIYSVPASVEKKWKWSLHSLYQKTFVECALEILIKTGNGVFFWWRASLIQEIWLWSGMPVVRDMKIWWKTSNSTDLFCFVRLSHVMLEIVNHCSQIWEFKWNFMIFFLFLGTGQYLKYESDWVCVWLRKRTDKYLFYDLKWKLKR